MANKALTSDGDFQITSETTFGNDQNYPNPNLINDMDNQS